MHRKGKIWEEQIKIAPSFQVTFTPESRGKHRVYVYLNGMEVKGSPFSLKIGKDVRERGRPAMDLYRGDKKVSR